MGEDKFTSNDFRFLGKRYEGRVDLKRVAVVGDGGYGGYIASLAMTDENFKCGVARSPITNWNLYGKQQFQF